MSEFTNGAYFVADVVGALPDSGWPVGQKFTYEFGQPRTENGDIACVVVDLDTATVDRAYVNGDPVSPDHAYAVSFMNDWTPPRQWKPAGLSLGDTGSHAIYDKALTVEQIAAHYTASQ